MTLPDPARSLRCGAFERHRRLHAIQGIGNEEFIWRMVLMQGLRPAAIGVALGIAGTLVGSRVLTSLLFNVTPWDVATLTTATGILLGVVVVAILLPARRASRIPPVEALKLER